MFSNNREVVQLSLFSVMLVFIPMFYFPEKFGMNLVTGSFTYSMFEIVFYGALFFAFRPKSSLVQLFIGAGLTFLFRIFIGTIFGSLLSLFYGMDLSVSLTLGVSRYLPAVILHILAAPFLMRSVFLNIASLTEPNRKTKTAISISQPVVIGSDTNRSQSSSPTAQREAAISQNQVIITREKGDTTSPGKATRSANTGAGAELNGFERAVKYIGEHGGVLLAAVVDHEGMILSNFKRQKIDPEVWAPYAVYIRQSNELLIGKYEKNELLSELEMSFGDKKLSVHKTGSLNLVVLANKAEDDLLNIRIAQGADIIRKYASERYGQILSAGMEVQHVSDTRRT